MPDGSEHRRRYAIVGAGARAEMFASALAVDYASTSHLVALADTNAARVAAHNARLVSLGLPAVAEYPASRFSEMLERERVETVVVATVDRFHDEYIVAAVESGRDVITEKPMTIDAARCRRILDAVASTGRNVTVTFNYRYNPIHEAVKRVLASGEIGELGSVHFEWLLDVRHGADYFRRWHRNKANSGGLMVHKASHHFDLVNWWLADEPAEVFAMGRRFFYGEEAGTRHGYARPYDRAHGTPASTGDPFALRMAEHPRLKALYLDAEHLDGYHRDQNVFAPGADIEDDMAVLVRYASGASLSYHLTAYSPWEGYRVMFNGSRGRLELEVVENDHVSLAGAGGIKGETRKHGSDSAALHGVNAAPEHGHARLTLHPFWTTSRDIPIQGYTRQGHGGADQRMLAAILAAPSPGQVDRLGRCATERDGAQALLVGLAANESFTTGRAVRVADLLASPPQPTAAPQRAATTTPMAGTPTADTPAMPAPPAVNDRKEPTA